MRPSAHVFVYAVTPPRGPSSTIHTGRFRSARPACSERRLNPSTVTATFGTGSLPALRMLIRIVSWRAMRCAVGNSASVTSTVNVPRGSSASCRFSSPPQPATTVAQAAVMTHTLLMSGANLSARESGSAVSTVAICHPNEPLRTLLRARAGVRTPRCPNEKGRGLVRSVADRGFLPMKNLLEEVGDMMILTGKTIMSALRPPYPYGGEFIGQFLFALKLCRSEERRVGK